MSTPRGIILWTLALLPLAGAVLAHRQESSPTLSIARPELPALAFDQYLVDLGPVQPAAEIEAKFFFRHRGHRTVKILELKPSCGCLQPRLHKTEYNPGEGDGLTLRIQPANEAPGKHEYTVDIKYLDPEPRETRLTFRVQLPEKGISITPPALMVFQFGSKETVQQIRITDTRDEDWKVMGVTVTLPFVKVSVGEPVRTESGALEVPLEATVAATVPPGRRRGLITVFTDNQQYPELKIPLMIQGPESSDEGDSAEQHTVP
jgi:hypothetical protein